MVIWGINGNLIIAVIGILATLALSMMIYKWQKTRKRITWELASNSRLLTVSEEIDQKLEILYEGIPVRQVSVALVRIFNSGNQPIAQADVERPIGVLTGPSSRILSAVVTEVSPPELQPAISVLQDRVVLAPVLMNAQDAITLKLIVSDLGTILLDGRIAGVRKFERVGPRAVAKRLRRVYIGFATSLVGFVVMTLLTPDSAPRPPAPLGAKISGAVAIAGYLIMASGVVRSIRIPLLRALFKRD